MDDQKDMVQQSGNIGGFFEYYKGCQDCQKFDNIQRVHTSAMNFIIKSWPFRGWGINLIGQIYPSSSKGHKFVLMATD